MSAYGRNCIRIDYFFVLNCINCNTKALEKLFLFRIYNRKPKVMPSMKKSRKLRESAMFDMSIVDSFAIASTVQEKFTVNKSSIGSTNTYEIARNVSIPADNVPHKVPIEIIYLKPDFEHEAVPKKMAYAFNKAKVINKSEYLLLSGPANVFFENNFVSKVKLSSFLPLS